MPTKAGGPMIQLVFQNHHHNRSRGKALSSLDSRYQPKQRPRPWASCRIITARQQCENRPANGSPTFGRARALGSGGFWPIYTHHALLGMGEGESEQGHSSLLGH